MIRDYERGSGVRGAAQSLVGERIVGVLLGFNNTVNIVFDSGSAVIIHAQDYGSIAFCPLNPDEATAHVKGLVRAVDRGQAALALIISRLVDCQSDHDCYAHSGGTGLGTAKG